MFVGLFALSRYSEHGADKLHENAQENPFRVAHCLVALDFQNLSELGAALVHKLCDLAMLWE